METITTGHFQWLTCRHNLSVRLYSLNGDCSHPATYLLKEMSYGYFDPTTRELRCPPLDQTRVGPD